MPLFETLVKYDTPKAVNAVLKERKVGLAKVGRDGTAWASSYNHLGLIRLYLQAKQGSAKSDSLPPPEDILSCIIPPRFSTTTAPCCFSGVCLLRNSQRAFRIASSPYIAVDVTKLHPAATYVFAKPLQNHTTKIMP